MMQGCAAAAAAGLFLLGKAVTALFDIAKQVTSWRLSHLDQ